jgi:serine/threonine protein kinase/Tol biopolymer transport system component
MRDEFTGELMIGTTLSHFEILEKIGEGGMGEVYRARDQKLGREVALKVLPEAFAEMADRLGRFAREAQVLATLNHENIAAIYGLEEDGGRHALVMELVAGETLEERIARGPIPLEECARIGLEMAKALESAHEKGIVHRDLKPANVKITPEGKVKVLDFGLAKALEGEPAAADIANSPTLTVAATQAGIILGTAAYMSPEQAAGATADRRSDIWSYGVVLSEMLSGRRQFSGETVSHTLASVLKDEPNWESLPSDVPPRIFDLLDRCLRKEPQNRLQAIGEARVLWQEFLADPDSFRRELPASAAAGPPAPAWKRILPWAICGLLALSLGAAGLQLMQREARPEHVLHSSVLPPEGHDWSLYTTHPGRVAISPDGQQLAYSAVAEGDSTALLWVHPLDSPVARPLPNTEGAGYPFWSPDGRYVAFFADSKLKKIAVAGGPPVSLCDAPYGKSGSWSANGTIVFTPSARAGIHRVPAGGGECVEITELDQEAGEDSHRHPVFLPDGEHFLFLARRSGGDQQNVVRVGSLDGTTEVALVESPSNAAFAAGRLLFVREGTLMAQPFDTGGLELTGEAVPLVEQILQIDGAALSVFSVSETGRLVYQSGQSNQNSRLVWHDREGLELGALPEAARHNDVDLSDDGAWAATTIETEGGSTDIWLYDTARQLRIRFTFDQARDVAGKISPDGTLVAFASERNTGNFDLYLKPIGGTGSAELLAAEDTVAFPYSWTPDGRTVLYTGTTGTEDFIKLTSLDGDREPVELLRADYDLGDPVVSPDGQWLAYTSEESGREEVFVTTFPGAERKWQVSMNGGEDPRWTRDGSEIIFSGSVDRTFYAAAVTASGGTFSVGEVTRLFTPDMHSDVGRDWDVTADGERFLINASPEQGRVSALNLVVDWPLLLEDR